MNPHSMKTSRIVLTIILAVVAGVGAWSINRLQHPSTQPSQLPVLGTVPEFSLRDQNNHVFQRKDLAGHPFILEFFFTSCTQFCSDMTEKMKGVRAALGPASKIPTVSISVDPDDDTPTVLRSYAKAHQADLPMWHFLTGPKATIGRIMQALYLMPSGDPSKLTPGEHSKRFILVDGTFRTRGYYDYSNPSSLRQLVKDALALEAAR